MHEALNFRKVSIEWKSPRLRQKYPITVSENYKPRPVMISEYTITIRTSTDKNFCKMFQPLRRQIESAILQDKSNWDALNRFARRS